MAILQPLTGISSVIGRELPVRIFPRIERVNTRFCVCSGVKDLEKGPGPGPIKSVGKNYNVSVWWLYGQVKESDTTPFQTSKAEVDEEERKKQDYYVNTGYAIRTLREEFPELFYRELSFGIYRDDIVFKSPFNTFSGIQNYKSIFWALRFHGKIFFRTLWVDIVCVWQPVENVIMVRWTVHGIPRIPWGESRSRFDGTSEYKLDKDGKIYEHKVHNIALNGPPKFHVLSVDQMIQSIGCPSTPKPTYFEFSSSSMVNIFHLINLSAVKRSVVYVLARTSRSRQNDRGVHRVGL